MKFSYVSITLAIAALIGSVVLVGCAGGGGAKKGGALADRATQRWNFLVNRDPGSAWEYLTPGSRAVTPKDRYIKETLVKPVKWTAARFVSENCTKPDLCKVQMTVDYKIRSHLTGVGVIQSTQILDETWIRESGTWYFLPSGD